MELRGAVLASALMMVCLSGCASSTTDAPPPSARDSSISAAPTPTTSESAATENQVASVIAGGESTWRDAIDDAGDCRFNLTVGDQEDPITKAETLTCFTNEVTAGVRAEIAIRDLNALTIPDSLVPLVDETKQALQMLVDADLEAACGDSMTPNQSKDCDETLGARFGSYTVLERVLDKWSPYL